MSSLNIKDYQVGDQVNISGGTAVKFDQGKAPMELLSPVAIEELAKVLGFGAKKYAARNWEKGMNFTRVIAAVLRHTFAYLRGETKDPETGLSHMAHAMCECMFLVHFELTKTGTDDRILTEPAKVFVSSNSGIEYGGLK